MAAAQQRQADAADRRVFFQLRPGGELRFGPGKAALLESIVATGSISAAGRKMGMSYRRAWNLVREMNQSFDTAVVVTQVGGRPDEGASVSDFGLDLLARYRRLEADVTVACEDMLKVMQSHAAKAPQGSSA